MNAESLRNVVRERFYRSLNEQGVQITAIPQEQLRGIVDAMADSLFAVLDELEKEGEIAELDAEGDSDAGTETSPATVVVQTPTVDHDEELLWRGRPYLTIGTIYELTNHRLRITRGILSNKIEEIELVRVRDTRLQQHMGERMINVGDITVLSADASAPEVILHNVRNPVAVREKIRQATVSERKRRGVLYREYMGNDDSGMDR
jgi:hypothetical protein